MRPEHVIEWIRPRLHLGVVGCLYTAGCLSSPPPETSPLLPKAIATQVSMGPDATAPAQREAGTTSSISDAGAAASGATFQVPEAFKGAVDASTRVTSLHARYGVRCTVEEDHMMDGGYRGMVHIVPQAPLGPYGKHLDFLDAALHASRTFERALADAAHGRSPTPLATPYRFVPSEVRFFRSEPKRTPSAYAVDMRIAYNVIGTLMQTEESVVETMIHEVFHLNDQVHGDWSTRRLSALHTRIVEKCKSSTVCLTPYAPGSTQVRGGTYYAFQPGNGPGEYAAEWMVRIYREVVHPVSRPFKCLRPENAEAHAALTQEFFGFDPVAQCP